jgi:hypothetical protein
MDAQGPPFDCSFLIFAGLVLIMLMLILAQGGAGGASDAAPIDVSDPCGLAADVDVRLGHIPFVVHARGMLRLDASHDGVSVESGASIINVKV